MKKIILDLAVTLDGYIEGANGEIDWLEGDANTDFGDILNDILVGIDTVFYGRISYEMWGNYQPDESASAKLKDAYASLHSKTKYVFSKSKTNDDTNAKYINGDVEARVREIQQQPGGNIWLYGGGELVTTFINLGLIDVYRLAVHPVILGAGKPLFTNLQNRTNLKLSDVKKGHADVLLLTYTRAD